jgi:hypothetical protein
VSRLPGFRVRLPKEDPGTPPTGWKAAFPMLSADGRRIGFRGLTLGAGIVYAPLDDARCVYGRRHQPPVRGCGCGFYCLHEPTEAFALTCATEYRDAAVLQVAVLGDYIRYQRGIRSQRQRVRRVLVGRCPCGRPAEAFVDAGTGVPGWRGLIGACAGCSGRRQALPFAEFGRLAGGGVTAGCDDRMAPPPAQAVLGGAAGGGYLPLPPELAGADGDADEIVPQLAAEAVLLQARLDWLQEQLAKLTDRP